ncbi:MAG TPA: hypothetical protein PLM22_05350 [Candidatus Sabulitectum sp.]|nr:hypothetical protein [Candidatus Sabulitectum sp.]HPF32623.1 hypothetical protein [Candidatus Sabulitectum sp.]HPJ28338.1 hypothetical protein [Candidatus Sabulitectum sp.]HPR21471.1 hypothetical protein [Candidatus Sabulitectum sp.]
MAEKPISEKFTGKVLQRVARNLRRIVIVCLLVAVFSSVWALTRAPRWSAWAAAIVPGSTATSLSATAGALGLGDAVEAMGSMGSGLLPGFGGVDITLAVQVLGSRRVQERIILKYDLITRYKSISMERALSKFGERHSVSISPEGVIFITAEGSTRTEAAAMVNDMITFANEELSRLVTSRARRSRIQTEAAMALALDSLNSSRMAMEEFRTRTGLVFPEEQASSMMEAMANIESEMVTAGALLEGISGTLSPRSAMYGQASAQYRYLENALRVRATTGDSLSVFPVMDSIPGYLSEYEALLLEVETRSAVYVLLRSELETLRIEEAKESPTIEVIVPPTPEFLRAYPKRTVMVILYTGIAFILCIVWTAFMTWLDTLMAAEETGGFLRGVARDAREQLLPRRRGPEKKK